MSDPRGLAPAPQLLNYPYSYGREASGALGARENKSRGAWETSCNQQTVATATVTTNCVKTSNIC